MRFHIAGRAAEPSRLPAGQRCQMVGVFVLSTLKIYVLPVPHRKFLNRHHLVVIISNIGMRVKLEQNASPEVKYAWASWQQ